MKTKNIWVTIIAIIIILLLIGGGIFMFAGVGKKEMIEVTAYSCDDATNICKVVGGTSQAIIGEFEKATDFGMKVIVTPKGNRNIINLKILSDTQNPATIIDPDPVGTTGTDAFYQALKNKQEKPAESGAIGTSTADFIVNTVSTCTVDTDCDSGAGEKCRIIEGESEKKCTIPVSEYITDTSKTYTFTAGVEATYTNPKGQTLTLSNSGSKEITFSPDISAPNLFSISVSESPF